MTAALRLPDGARCRRCGSAHLSVQVLAWAEFEAGAFIRLEADQPAAHLANRRFAACIDCGSGQRLELEADDTRYQHGLSR